MITNHDRSGWFGASDVDYIIGNWHTKSFSKWWLTKLGMNNTDFATTPMLAGTYKEHQILDYLGVPIKDRQILVEDLQLRVNLDGNDDEMIYEVKTHKASDKKFSVPIKYKRQVWVQMYATGLRQAFIVAYGMKEEDYDNFFLPIDESRLEQIKIEYNQDFIEKTFLPAITTLKSALEKGVFPDGYKA